MADNILETIKDRIRREMNEIADDLALGGCISAESAGMVGVKYAQNAGYLMKLKNRRSSTHEQTSR